MLIQQLAIAGLILGGVLIVPGGLFFYAMEANEVAAELPSYKRGIIQTGGLVFAVSMLLVLLQSVLAVPLIAPTQGPFKLAAIAALILGGIGPLFLVGGVCSWMTKLIESYEQPSSARRGLRRVYTFCLTCLSCTAIISAVTISGVWTSYAGVAHQAALVLVWVFVIALAAITLIWWRITGDWFPIEGFTWYRNKRW